MRDKTKKKFAIVSVLKSYFKAVYNSIDKQNNILIMFQRYNFSCSITQDITCYKYLKVNRN